MTTARTVIAPLKQQGLIIGGRWKPAVVRKVDRDVVLSALRYQDEEDHARHPVNGPEHARLSTYATCTTVEGGRWRRRSDVVRAPATRRYSGRCKPAVEFVFGIAPLGALLHAAAHQAPSGVLMLFCRAGKVALLWTQRLDADQVHRGALTWRQPC